ncbi:MAG: hypothetical protein IJW22_03800 [Clostridia bacterium]|nr:hypothetical protein [Clostridia bacterium]
MKLLFIGNSHSYYNALPETVFRLLEATGAKPHVTALAEGGKGLSYHASSPNTTLNIRCGRYDAVIAQDRASTFDAITFRESAKALRELTERADTRFFLYMPSAGKDNREAQRIMTEAYLSFCHTYGCSFAPVGEVFYRLMQTEDPELLDREDGKHATPIGGYVAAVTIFYTITGRKRVINVTTIDDPGVAGGFPVELCQRIHTEACRTTRLYHG